MSYNSNLNPNVVKTALDDVYMQEMNGDSHPGHATAETGAIFHQDTADSSAVIWELFKGVGEWQTRQEEQNVPMADPKIGNTKTFSVVNYSKSIDIPKNFFDDAKHSAYEKMVRDMARRARTTRDKNAFGLLRGYATTTKTADGVVLGSASHLNMNGDTVSNLVSGAFSESTLFSGMQGMLEMKAQDGVIDGFLGTDLVVPMALFKTACQAVKSELRSGTANNDINVYSSQYGIRIWTSPYLGAAAGGSDNAWFLLSPNHSMYRWVRQGVTTDLVPYQYQRNNNYIYKGEFREAVGVMSYEGIICGTGV